MPIRLIKADRLLRNARIIVPVGFGLVLAAALAVAYLLALAQDADNNVVKTFDAQRATRSLLISLADAETGQRGYLLTMDQSYLAPFTRAQTEVPVALERLDQLTLDNPSHQSQVAALRPLIQAKLAELNRTISLAKDGQREAAMSVVRSDEGLKLMDDIRSKLSTLLEQEGGSLAQRQQHAGTVRNILTALIVVALLTATILAALLAVASQHAVKGLIDRTRELETESRLRQEAEDTLRQAHKMEAVGQLTGGVAHDFNNLLTIIVGNLDTMKRQLANLGNPGTAAGLAEKLQRPIESALQGARSAAQLTQRLLAFSRRQPLEPNRIDLNKLVAGMLDMLRRTIGENTNIETVLGAGLWPTFADPHQLENALLNLALNAKDAMPDGGCLTIETANTYLDEAYVRRFGDVEAGQYVVLCVTDTGTGIAKDVIERVFEPFFTTKPHGEGSGLGLAMVHGFVKQSGGHIRIYSEEGQGTTVKIYLPRLTQAEEMSAVPTGKADEDLASIPRAKAGETILLVEDNDGVREYAKTALAELGYAVLEAADGEQGLKLIARRPPVTLLFTDVVLPGGLSGRQFADRAREVYPGLPVLFTTGYTRNAIVHQGRLDPNVHLLNKPYTQQDLARKVREMIDTTQT